MQETRLERHIDLPRSIVWEALVDPVLVAGWLHPTRQLVTGTTPLEFVEPESAAPAVLHVVSPEFGEVRIQLTATPGGTRGESTRLELRLSGDAAGWPVRLDQLDALLRGHPVDWRALEREQQRRRAL